MYGLLNLLLGLTNLVTMSCLLIIIQNIHGCTPSNANLKFLRSLTIFKHPLSLFILMMELNIMAFM